MTGPGSWTSPSDDPTATSAAPLAPTGSPSSGAWQAPPGWGAPPRPVSQPGVVPLRPLGLGELLDGAVGLIRRYPRPVLGLSAALAIISTVLNIVVAVTAFRPLFSFDAASLSGQTTSTDQIDGVIGGAAAGSIGSGLVSALSTLVLTGILTAVAGRGVLGERMTLREAWDQVRPVLGRLLGIALLTGLVVYGSLVLGFAVLILLVVVAGGGVASGLVGVLGLLGALCLTVYLYCRLSLAPCVAVLEKAGVRTSMRRSGVLVRRSWWRVFGVLLLALVVGFVVSQVVQIPFLAFGISPLGFRGGADIFKATTRLLVLTYIGNGIAQTLIAPFNAAVRALLYIDRRMRAEGLDVALAAAAAQRTA
jgi:hypothetical protein